MLKKRQNAQYAQTSRSVPKNSQISVAPRKMKPLFGSYQAQLKSDLGDGVIFVHMFISR